MACSGQKKGSGKTHIPHPPASKQGMGPGMPMPKMPMMPKKG